MANYARVFALMATMVAVLFGSAGRLDLPFIWATVGIYTTFITVSVLRMEPGLLQERLRPGPGGTDRWMRFVMIPVVIGQWTVAGLDVGRYHWSDTVPVPVQILSLAGFAAGLSLVGWAMAVNRYFSSVVRIQTDRGHRVITGGPYRLVRHPGYLGGMVSSVFGTLALGSWLALIPTAVFFAVFLRRLVIEDEFLLKELAGYAEYARQTKYRLVPGVW